jgi:hypothetical protein
MWDSRPRLSAGQPGFYRGVDSGSFKRKGVPLEHALLASIVHFVYINLRSTA